MTVPDRIPVHFLSGFLGAGKSTLLNELLSDPAFHDTAVIINEFGNVPVDHLLIRRGETTVSQVSTGCLCCTGGSDIRLTLSDLYHTAKSDPAVSFSRVIVEMSGLGDPAPLVNALSSDLYDKTSVPIEPADGVFFLAGFVTLFDVVAGAFSLENHFEALKQIAFADRIVLTKTDLASDSGTRSDIAALPRELRALNAGAEVVDRQDADLGELFSPRAYSVVERGEDVAGWLALETALAAEAGDSHRSNSVAKTSRHQPGIQTFSIVSDTAIPEKRIKQLIVVLQNSAGHRLLRVKGIVATEETPERPLIIHAVQHVLSDPVRLDSWPDDDHRTRLVFITSEIDPEPIRSLFAAVVDGKSQGIGNFFPQLGVAISAKFANASAKFTNLTRRMT